MTQQEWRDAFKKDNGREPSLDEFKAAKANGFAMTAKQTEPSEKEILQAWVADFEKKYGRKPSIDEVKQRQFIAPAAAAETTTPVEADTNVAPHRKGQTSNKKRGWKMPTLIIVVIALVAGYFYGQNYYSYDSSMDRAVKVLDSRSADKYSKNLTWSDTDKKLTKSEVAPLVKYMKTGATKATIESLLKSSSSNISLKKTGNRFFIFPKYQVVVKPINLKVYTNHSGLKVTANDQVIVKDSDEDEAAIVKHQAPGYYEFVAKGDVDGDTYKGTDSESVFNNNNSEINLYAYQTSSSSSSSSSSSKSKLTKSDANSLLSDMASLLSSVGAKDSSSYNSDVTASDVFVDGSSNKAYTDFTEMISNNKTKSKRIADSINFGSIDVQDIKSTGKKTADVTFKIKEDFYYSSDTDQDKHTSGTLTQTFLLKAHVKYDKSESKWLIDSIDSDQKKLSESDNVN